MSMNQATCQTVFESLVPERLEANPHIVATIDACCQFDLSGDGGGQWVVDLTKEEDWVHTGAVDDPDVTITMSASDFLDIVHGELSDQAAFMQGKLKVDGDVTLALMLQLILD